MSSESYSTLSLVLSSIALLISGCAFGWNIYRDVLDKGRLTIKLMIGRIEPYPTGAIAIDSDLHAELVASGKATGSGNDLLIATITNVGRRAIMAQKWGSRTPTQGSKKSGAVILSRTLPKTLQPGDFAMEWTDNLSVLAGNTKGFWVSDSTGREWKVDGPNFRKVRAKAESILAARERRA